MTCPEAFTPKPGSFFLTRQTGKGGRLVAAAQALVRGASTYTHAGIVLRGGQVLEALPGGAQVSSWEKIVASGPVLVCDRPVRDYVASHRFGNEMPRTIEWFMRNRIVDMAERMVGVPYSWLDYLAIAMTEWKVPGWQLARGRVESSQRLICSAMVDRVYAWSGITLFADGRLAGDVTPWDLSEYSRHEQVISC